MADRKTPGKLCGLLGDLAPHPGLDVDGETVGESRPELGRLAEVLEASVPPCEIEAGRHASVDRAIYDSS
ncbi:MAG: hypothetical protein F4X77_03520 [Acidobacteriia bacterium]|nr:hypothetical protein [Terriglobia bacterium]